MKNYTIQNINSNFEYLRKLLNKEHLKYGDIGYIYICNAPHYGGREIREIINNGGGITSWASRKKPAQFLEYLRAEIKTVEAEKKAVENWKAENIDKLKAEIKAELLGEILTEKSGQAINKKTKI